MHALLSQLLLAVDYPAPSALGVNATTARLFTTVHNESQSSRALGWDTNSYAASTYRGCGNLSTRTFTHTGCAPATDRTRDLHTPQPLARAVPPS
jgi:hypothetical protein